MFNIFRKRVDTVNVTYDERIEKLERQVNKQKNEILDLYTDIEAIRSKVLRKIQTRKQPEEEEEPQDLRSKILIPE